MVPPSSEAGQDTASDSVSQPKVDSLTSPPPSSEAGQDDVTLLNPCPGCNDPDPTGEDGVAGGA